MSVRKTFLEPKTILEFLTMILTILGGAFLLIGAISRDCQFIVAGSILLIIALCIFPITRLHHKSMENLIKVGKFTYANVVRIKHYWFMNLGTQSLDTTTKRTPYRIFYEYERKGQHYSGHSCLLWKRPTLSRGDMVPIIMDENNPNKNCLDVDFLTESKYM